MQLHRVLVMVLFLGLMIEPEYVVADEVQHTKTPASLDDETRARWMANIVKGLIGLATESDPPNEHYRYCASGFTAFSNLEISRAVSRAAQTPDAARPWLTPIYVATPDYRPYSSTDICPGGQFLFGDMDGDILDMLNTHRRKQRSAIHDWPYALNLQMLHVNGEGFAVGIPPYVFQRGADQMFAAEHGLSRDLTSLDDALTGSCPVQAHQIVFYFRFDSKEVRHADFEDRYSRFRGGGYRIACLTVDENTLHIDLTEPLYKRADIY